MIFKFFKKSNEKPNSNEESINIACLLIHAAKIDENYTSEEKEIIKKTVKKLYPELNNLDDVFSKAEQKENDSNHIQEFTKGVKSLSMENKTIIVAVPADRSPLLRIRGANRATAIAEYFRGQGKNVLLIMDSLTRVAHAQREIGLGSGEQPTSKGYPPSVVSLIPRLIERSGTGKVGEGSITAFYTVLADGDDTNDPVVDAARAILDGHIVLSRQQSLLGIYPAVDVPNSISRVMNEITDGKQQKAAIDFKKNISLYLDNRDLLLMGGYSEGQDEDLDRAISMWPDLVNHISQKDDVGATYSDSKSALIKLLGE